MVLGKWYCDAGATYLFFLWQETWKGSFMVLRAGSQILWYWWGFSAGKFVNMNPHGSYLMAWTTLPVYQFIEYVLIMLNVANVTEV